MLIIITFSAWSNFKDETYLNQYHIGEKTGIPLLTKTIFFHNTHPNTNKRLNECGIETFDNLLDDDIDKLPMKYRIDKILLLCDKINNMSFEQLSKFYNSDSIKEKLDKNFNTIKYWKNPYNQKNEVELFLGEHI